MPSSFDDKPPISGFGSAYNVSQAGLVGAPEEIDLGQIYVLIDSILPFEACLYYQVLPLVIEGSRLTIGVVNPDDPGAADYVKKQLSYINYSISFKTIPSDWHRDLLSKYLNYTAKKRQHLKDSAAPDTPAPPPAARSPQPAPQENLQQTFIVDQPDEILDPGATPTPDLIDHTLAGDPLTPLTLTPDESSAEAADAADALPEPAAMPATELAPDAVPASVAAVTPGEPPTPEGPLQLRLDARYREVAMARLPLLPPQALMQALLSKVLEEGIGRLYFERRSQIGRILWSRDGILQAVVESIDGSVFQGVINELKLLTHLSLIPVTKARQVEIERSYEGQRILLRFRVMPSANGEEATLQVLRGTALRFYQQQQIDRLGRDALDTAQVLQSRLHEIRDRARDSLNFNVARSETLPALIELLQQMEAQVQAIVAAYDLDETAE
ncbi:MAG TPA: hypothetical protein V6D02_15435 [Candidatus Obscuribacterales bacterium]